MRVAHYQGKKKSLKFLIGTLKGVLWADTTFPWFADVHAFAAVLFSKIFIRKSIVVVEGYEVAHRFKYMEPYNILGGETNGRNLRITTGGRCSKT